MGGGLTPTTSLLPGCILAPPREGGYLSDGRRLVFSTSLSRVYLLGHRQETNGYLFTTFHRYSPDFLGTTESLLPIYSGLSWDHFLVVSRVAFALTTCVHTCFFFRNRPPEESDNKRSSTRRGESDSSTPEAIGVLLG